MRYTNKLAAVAAVALTGVSAANITPTGDANTLANAILGPGVSLISASFQGAATGSGTYTDGPLGIKDAAILTSGDALHPYDPSTSGTEQDLPGFGRCDDLSGGVSFDAAVLTMEVELDEGYPGFFSQFVFASDEYPEYVGSDFNDVFGIWINGTQIAFDDTGAPITINGPFFSGANVLTPPASGPYGGSTPLLQAGFASLPGYYLVEIAVCDVADYIRDSAVFITLSGCSDGAACKNGTVISPPSNTTTSAAPYTTEAPDVITKYETEWHTITSCPETHPCHPVTSAAVVTYTLTKSVTVPCVTSTYVDLDTTKYVTVTLEAITTWVTCTEIPVYKTTPPVYVSPTYTTKATVYVSPSYTTKAPVATYTATASKPIYYPPKNTSSPITFTGGATGIQVSTFVGGLVGLFALIPVFFL
ncbi:hypothetical protein FGG08_002413 [Glutinoglossum americanum]|uniref:Uncharacterized protein n=1 Tax=Glutinoglossum americanum TaxID=1670608 RepID=A0A9P8I6B5_9PEZI|nr:hypothetical protein FGG08_002413 [Glutinoglossum americanum]